MLNAFWVTSRGYSGTRNYRPYEWPSTNAQADADTGKHVEVVDELVLPTFWKGLCGYRTLDVCGWNRMGKTRMDERGRVLIPNEEREKLGLKSGAEFELVEEKGVLLLKPIVSAPVRVKSKRGKWGKEAFLDSGEATFGE